jgi:ATP phosphoribosyltransferase
MTSQLQKGGGVSKLLNFGIPKGRLEEATFELFRKAGRRITTASRSYFPKVDDDEMKCSLIRPQEMGRYVERGTIDVGFAGRDWLRKNDTDVVEVFVLLEDPGATAGRIGIPESSGFRPGWLSP